MAYTNIIERITQLDIDTQTKIDLLDHISADMDSNENKSLSDIARYEKALLTVVEESKQPIEEVNSINRERFVNKPTSSDIAEIARKARLIK